MPPTRINRDAVVNKARTYINIGGWSPTVDQYNFGQPSGNSGLTQIFSSCFIRRGTYNVTPYVYGKPNDSQIPSPTQIRNAINQSAKCPGGWDRSSGKGTGRWWAAYDAQAVRNLVGIDCSQYVMKCLGCSTRSRSAAMIGDFLCVKIRKKDLKKGDFILKRGHIIIFNKWTNNQKTVANIFEARGLPEPEPPRGYSSLRIQFGPSYNNIGCVVNQNVNVLGICTTKQVRISDCAGNFLSIRGIFGPYSIFPQFSGVQIQSGRITVTIKGSGCVNILTIWLDRNVITGRCSVSGIDKQKTISYQTPQGFSTGGHHIAICATNSILGKAFLDTQEFAFQYP